MARNLVLIVFLLSIVYGPVELAPSSDASESSLGLETTTGSPQTSTLSPPLVLKESPPAYRDGSVQDVKGSLGESCDTDEKCRLPNTSCQGDVCSCDASFMKHPDENRCIPLAHRLRDECEITKQCRDGLDPNVHGLTTCLDTRCVCAPGLHDSNGKCIGKLKLGQPCKADQECTVQHSKCLQGICACPSAYLPNKENEKCIQKAGNFNDSCDMDEQCDDLGEAICKSNRCECKAMMILVNGRCSMMKELGAPCSVASECQTNLPSDQRDCINNFCNCTRGFIQKEDICMKAGSSSIRMSILTLITTLLIKYFIF